MEGASEFTKKQNAEAKKASGSKSGKTSIDSLSQLRNLPGVKTINRHKKK